MLKAAAVIKKCSNAEIPKPKIVSYLTNKGVNKMEVKAAIRLYKERPDELPTIQDLIVCVFWLDFSDNFDHSNIW